MIQLVWVFQHALGIKDKHIQLQHSEMIKNEFHIWPETKQIKQKCPRCKNDTKRVHAYRMQCIQGRLIEDKPVIIRLKKRRYLCITCGHTFNENLLFVSKYQRHTTSLEQQVLVYTAENSFTDVGRIVGMHTNRVMRIFDR